MLLAMINGLKVAILVTACFEQTEMEGPKAALEQQGAKVFLVAPMEGKVAGWDCYGLKPRDEFPVDVVLKNARAEDFDALIIPGAICTDDLRTQENAVDFVKGFADKPIGTICHGPQLLISADLIRGKTLTAYPSIEIDIVNAGGKWANQEVVQDGQLVSSRFPADIPAFNAKFIEVLEKYSSSVDPKGSSKH